MICLKLLSVDAWNDNGGWTWNDVCVLESDIYFAETELTTRKILRFLRRAGYLTDKSKGKLTVRDVAPGDYCFEICLKGTLEPVLALSAIH